MKRLDGTQGEDEISFDQGEYLIINAHRTAPEGWVYASKEGGVEGLAPSAYLDPEHYEEYVCGRSMQKCKVCLVLICWFWENFVNF